MLSEWLISAYNQYIFQQLKPFLACAENGFFILYKQQTKEKIIMWNAPSKKQLSTLPTLYATENVPLKDKIIHLHFFIGGCDWFIAEFDGDDLFFGFTILNQDYQNAEWGYISFGELKSIKVQGWLEIDRDIHWKVRPAKEVDLICEAQGW